MFAYVVLWWDAVRGNDVINQLILVAFTSVFDGGFQVHSQMVIANLSVDGLRTL